MRVAPRLHDLSLTHLFGCSSSIPWATGTTAIRRPPRENNFLMTMPSRTSSFSSICQQKLQRLQEFDPEFLESTLRKDFIEPFLFDRFEFSGSSSCIHLPADVLLASQSSFADCFLPSPATLRHQQDTSGTLGSSSTTNSNNRVKFWVHCSSFEQVEELYQSFIAPRIQKNLLPPRCIGVCLPFPTNSFCGNVLFGTGDEKAMTDAIFNEIPEKKKNQNQQQEKDDQDREHNKPPSSEFEERFGDTLENLIDCNVPVSVWLLSALSCPFGGREVVDAIEVSDHVLTFLEEYRCSEVFLDDTAGTAAARHYESFIKTVYAASSSSSFHNNNNNESSKPDLQVDFSEKIAFCPRTSSCNIRGLRQLMKSDDDENDDEERENKNTKKSSLLLNSMDSNIHHDDAVGRSSSTYDHRSTDSLLHSEIQERIYRCYMKNFSNAYNTKQASSLFNFCGSSNCFNYSDILENNDDVGVDKNEENKISTENDDKGNNKLSSSAGIVRKTTKKTNTFIPLSLYADWTADMSSSLFEMDPLMDSSESSIEAQKRFQDMEQFYVNEIEMVRRLDGVL